MALSSRYRRQVEAWPGYVDVLSTLLMVIVFVLMIFVIGQMFLSNALSGRKRHAAIAASAANKAEIRKRPSGPGSTTALRWIRLLTAVAWI